MGYHTPVPVSCPHSPECLEDKFWEVCIAPVLWGQKRPIAPAHAPGGTGLVRPVQQDALYAGACKHKKPEGTAARAGRA
jgi:hypothetical protein